MATANHSPLVAGQVVTTSYDLRVTLDERRSRCPIHHLDDGSISLLSHHDVREAALDPDTYSSAVSSHRALPNSLDGEEHRSYRALVDKYLTDQKVADQEPQCREHARRIIGALPRNETIEVLDQIGTPFAVRAQSTWLGWPEEVEDALVSWVVDNREAIRSGNRTRLAQVADQFDAIVRELLAERKSGEFHDVTSQLMAETIDGRALPDHELVSILRNWTAGDLGSLSDSVGVIVHQLATDDELQSHMRELVSLGDIPQFEEAVEELLRIDDPFVSNRRVTTRDTTIAGTEVPAGTRVLLNWTAANRDPEVFADPDTFDPDANAGNNLVFGIGPHVCPGRALTLMELRVVLWELLTESQQIVLSADEAAVRDLPPVNGWARVPVVLDPSCP